MKRIIDLPTCVIAEENGLVTVFVDTAVVPAGLQSLPNAHRVRLDPPADLLREDGHVFDLDAASSYVERRVLAPLVRGFPALKLTDAVIGIGRFSLGLRHPGDDVDARAVEAAIEKLAIEPWELESTELVRDHHNKRELGLLDELRLLQSPPHGVETPEGAIELARRIRALPRDGSFVEQAALDTQYPHEDVVTEALRWVDAQLVELNRRVLAQPVAGLPETAKIELNVNCHPQSRSFSFVVTDPEDSLDIPAWYPELDQAVAEWLDAPEPLARRVPGILWNSRFDFLHTRFTLIEVEASS